MPTPETPNIQTTGVQAAGAPIEIVAFVDPDQFPHGMELAVYRVGNNLVPIGTVVVNPGCMLAVVPPSVAQHILGQAKAAAAAQAKATPGLQA